MSYQAISKPRLYVNVPQYQHYIGQSDFVESFFTLPVGTTFKTLPSGTKAMFDGQMTEKMFLAILGHKFGSTGGEYGVGGGIDLYPVINGQSQDSNISPDLDGFSISTFNGEGASTFAHEEMVCGSYVIGFYYDFPRAPDLNLTLSYEYDGVEQRTLPGGYSVNNIYYTQSPKWGDLGAWELSNPEDDDDKAVEYSSYARNGRRVWDLSFSYLEETDVFAERMQITDVWSSHSNTLGSSDTLSRVLQYSVGGLLPMIFMPDASLDSEGNYNNTQPDNFAIVGIVQKSLKFQKVTDSHYNVRMKLRETW